MPLDPKPLTDGQVEAMVRFLRDEFASVPGPGIIGLSGGVDSAVVCALAVRALGTDRVRPFYLVGPYSRASDERDAETVSASLGLELTVRDLTSAFRAMAASAGLGDDRSVPAQNLMARLRMCALYLEANRTGGAVLGTSTKSEAMVGYFTKYGDGASDVAPLADVYKTQVKDLACRLGLPEAVILKEPSAALAPDQTDEGDLGLSYEVLDRILAGLERSLDPRRIANEAGVTEASVRSILARVDRAGHKRKGAKVPKIGLVTPFVDLRE